MAYNLNSITGDFFHLRIIFFDGLKNIGVRPHKDDYDGAV